MRTGAAIADVAGGLVRGPRRPDRAPRARVLGPGAVGAVDLLQAGIALMDFQAARYLMKGEVPGQVGNDHPTSMPTSAYKTADGYINVGASGEGMWKRLCEAIGRPDLARAARVRRAAEARAKNRAPLNAEMNDRAREALERGVDRDPQRGRRSRAGRSTASTRSSPTRRCSTSRLAASGEAPAASARRAHRSTRR